MKILKSTFALARASAWCIWAVGGRKLSSFTPMLTDAPSVSGGAVSISLAGQSGEKTPFVAYATLDYKGE
ncbi:MAG: hypothetical protein MJY77_09490, partial [Bacteroidaceae bacterium]|nr:hypothetical protein [Bacteroidaceae bacterium]